jgi:hypothetical protein
MLRTYVLRDVQNRALVRVGEKQQVDHVLGVAHHAGDLNKQFA